MVEETITNYMGEDHREVSLVCRNNGNYSVTPSPLKYTESMLMAEIALNKLSPEFVEIWNDESGWNCNLVVDGTTYKSKNESMACSAITNAMYNYLRRDDEIIISSTFDTDFGCSGTTLIN